MFRGSGHSDLADIVASVAVSDGDHLCVHIRSDHSYDVNIVCHEHSIHE